MKILFADVTDPYTHAAKELGTDVLAVPTKLGSPKKFWQVLIEQLLNSFIVGSIAGLAALSANNWDITWRVALYSFALTLLLEMRKYRLGP